MIESLTVENVALIERAEIEFGPGLNVLSGETGAGKSVILDSINFVLGAKADKSIIRHGAESCSVRAVFRVSENDPVFAELAEQGLDPDEIVVIARRFRQDGRGDIKINGTTVNASMLRRVTAHLVDVHGQSEHFYLLSEANQFRLLDKTVGAALDRQKEELGQLLEEVRRIRGELKTLGGDEAERGRRLDILQYQIDEIDRAGLQEGEEERLTEQRRFFNNAEKIASALSGAEQALDAEGAAIDGLRSARHAVAGLASFGAEYGELESRLENVLLEAEDIGETLHALFENTTYDEREAQEVEERLDLLKSLKKKYGASVGQIFEYRKAIGEEFDLLSHSDEKFAELSAALAADYKKVYRLCCEMTEIRKKEAERFCARVVEQLKTLNIKNARFCVEFAPYTEQDAERASADGLDSVRFLFSANAGEPLKPLSKVISGGEMSRLMLAIKTCMTDSNGISAYIFDEIDAGISGETAKTVAEKFALIARSTQIVAVSHLAQIAAMADSNFLIYKEETGDGKTRTRIRALEGDERLRELIRLLGGSADSAAARSLAEELLERCTQYKSSL